MACPPPTPQRAQRRQQGIPNGPAEVRLKYANDAIRKGSSSLEICLGLLKVTMEQTQEKVEGNHVLQTPLWIVIIRGFQFLISLIIVGLCGRLMHDATLDEEALSLAIAIISWIVIAYVVFTEKIPSLQSAYHIIAVLSLDALLMVLWLAAWAATAARRAKYVVPVNAYGCVDDGSLTDSKTCNIFKRDGENVILFKSGLAMLAAVAGLGALVWILFIVTFVWTLVMFLRGRKEGRFAVNLAASPSPNNNYQMETKVNEGQPMVQPVQPQGVPQQQYQQQPTQGQFVPQQQQQQAHTNNRALTLPPAAPYSPQDQQYQGQQNYGQYPPQQYQQPPQPQGSELDGQTNYSTPPPASMSLPSPTLRK
ncbi:Marvel domain [Fusarium oxysporum f. sp. vasinfectum]|nr:Marvel domain [Fusarium oxysporum f. sp. vasinfectum]